jgi:hypothetical protein
VILVKAISVLVPVLAGAGLVFVWSAIHGANISASLRDILAGRKPVEPLTDPALVTLGRILPGAPVGVGAGTAAGVGGSAVGAAAGQAVTG